VVIAYKFLLEVVCFDKHLIESEARLCPVIIRAIANATTARGSGLTAIISICVTVNSARNDTRKNRELRISPRNSIEAITNELKNVHPAIVCGAFFA
jgi:hypothetical protein